MKKFALLVILVVMLFTVNGAKSFDFIEVDVMPNLMVWWIHNGNNIQTQVYGVPKEWSVVAAGPIFQIPGTKLSLQLPAGLRLDNTEPGTPVTHWVGKINIIGSIGPFSVTIINDKSWGKGINSHLFFYKDIVLWKVMGVRLEGFKFGNNPLPAMLGPILIYEFGSSTFQIFTGINLRNRNERCFKFEYLFKKF
ncbi:MAG: hypothetical protein WC650_01860 [Candidatus Doudnabacteria bacterium]